jgi:hypothetical protein
MKYVSPLTGDEIIRLNGIVKDDPSPRVRHRAHYILLSAKGYKIDEIADIFALLPDFFDLLNLNHYLIYSEIPLTEIIPCHILLIRM